QDPRVNRTRRRNANAASMRHQELWVSYEALPGEGRRRATAPSFVRRNQYARAFLAGLRRAGGTRRNCFAGRPVERRIGHLERASNQAESLGKSPYAPGFVQSRREPGRLLPQ